MKHSTIKMKAFDAMNIFLQDWLKMDGTFFESPQSISRSLMKLEKSSIGKFCC